MANPTLYQKFAASSLCVLVGLSFLPELAFARTTFRPPANTGLPGRREPAGTRGPCLLPTKVDRTSTDTSPRNIKTLLAMVPGTERANVGLTVSGYPTFFWYVPENKAESMEFTLKDEVGQEIYRTTFKVSGNPGIMSLSLPANSGLPPLDIGKNYNWSIKVICDASNPGGDPSVEGWIQRVVKTRELIQTLDKARPIDYPNTYGSAGLWHDMLSSLAELRRTNPKNQELTTDWQKLLNSVGLGKIAQEPLI